MVYQLMFSLLFQAAYDQALANTPETKITTLSNGFRVVTEQVPLLRPFEA